MLHKNGIDSSKELIINLNSSIVDIVLNGLNIRKLFNEEIIDILFNKYGIIETSKITKSSKFHPSLKYIIPKEIIFRIASMA